MWNVSIPRRKNLLMQHGLSGMLQLFCVRDYLWCRLYIRNTLEQIDVARLLIDKYPNVCLLSPLVCSDRWLFRTKTFKFADSSDDIKIALAEGKIASLLGVEGCVRISLLLTKFMNDRLSAAISWETQSLSYGSITPWVFATWLWRMYATMPLRIHVAWNLERNLCMAVSGNQTSQIPAVYLIAEWSSVG